MEHRISIGRLRQNPTEMIRDVKRGVVYTLTDRGQPIADIAPHRPTAWRSGEEVAALLAELGPDPRWSAEAGEPRSDEQPRDPWATR